jgi:hypothetical protein
MVENLTQGACRKHGKQFLTWIQKCIGGAKFVHIVLMEFHELSISQRFDNLHLRDFLFVGGLNPNLNCGSFTLREREHNKHVVATTSDVIMSALILTCVCVWVCISVVWPHHLDLVDHV